MLLESAGLMSKVEDHVQDLKDKILNRYRIRMVLDNMPITTFDLTTVRLPPESTPQVPISRFHHHTNGKHTFACLGGSLACGAVTNGYLEDCCLVMHC